jgi:hypothetical protein
MTRARPAVGEPQPAGPALPVVPDYASVRCREPDADAAFPRNTAWRFNEEELDNGRRQNGTQGFHLHSGL